jgi:proteasome lid subunit RPN8/RPN11
MLEQARTELPNECCGLLAGIIFTEEGKRIGRVVQRYPLVNAAAAPERFLSEDKSMLAAHRDWCRCGTDVLAVYHSHPTSAAIPSKTDLKEWSYGEYAIALIISLEAEEPLVRGWWLTETDYREAEWRVLE